MLFGSPGHDLYLSRITLNLLNPRLCFFMVLQCDLFVYMMIHCMPMFRISNSAANTLVFMSLIVYSTSNDPHRELMYQITLHLGS